MTKHQPASIIDLDITEQLDWIQGTNDNGNWVIWQLGDQVIGDFTAQTLGGNIAGVYDRIMNHTIA